MKTCKKLSFSKKIIVRNRIMVMVLILMLAYMVVVGELGAGGAYGFIGDSRSMAPFAEFVRNVIFFGSIVFIVIRIMQNRKLLKNGSLLKNKMVAEADELNQMLYDKSGGVVMDIVLIGQLFITVTTSLMDMTAFNTAFATLTVVLAAKLIAYLIFRKDLL